MNNLFIYRYFIYGSKRLYNFLWATLIFFGSLSFISIGLTTYFQSKISFIIPSINLSFFPQGLVMLFYGLLGLFLSFYLFLNIFFKIGSGFNEFNKKDNIIRIFRWGFPGKRRQLQFCYSISDIKSLKIIKTSPEVIYLCLKGDYEIPLSKIGQSNSLMSLENQAIDIASFLGVPLTFM